MSTGLAKTSLTRRCRMVSELVGPAAHERLGRRDDQLALGHRDRQDPVALRVRIGYHLGHRGEIDLQRIDVQVRQAQLGRQPLGQPVQVQQTVGRLAVAQLRVRDQDQRMAVAAVPPGRGISSDCSGAIRPSASISLSTSSSCDRRSGRRGSEQRPAACGEGRLRAGCRGLRVGAIVRAHSANAAERNTASRRRCASNGRRLLRRPPPTRILARRASRGGGVDGFRIAAPRA